METWALVVLEFILLARNCTTDSDIFATAYKEIVDLEQM